MKKSNSEIIQNTIDIIRKKMKERQLTHKDVSELCSKNGEPVAPKTVGNMLNNPTSTTMSTLLKVCNALELNLSAILHSIESGLNSDNTKLFYDISNPAYSGYTGEYHVFFLSTIPNTDAHMEKPLIHGTLKLGDLHSVHECTAILDIDSGDIDKNGEQFTKHYEGVLVYSSNGMMFCNLIGNEYGDMWFLVFNHGNLNSNELACVLGCGATSSSGRTTRYPSIHRFCLCNKQKYPVINDETKRHIQGLLRLQNNELYVKKENVQTFLRRNDLDPTFRKNLENYLNIADEYLELPKSVLRNKVQPSVFANTIAELCEVSAHEKTYYIFPNDDDELTSILRKNTPSKANKSSTEK